MRFGLLLLALALATPLSAEPGVKMFGGWIAGCSNENICTAIRPVWGAIDGSRVDPAMPFLQIRHHPQRDATPEIRLIDQKNASPDAALRPPLAVFVVHFHEDSACKGDCKSKIATYYARIDGKGGYRFDDEDARWLFFGLRRGNRVFVTISGKIALPLDTAHLDEALAHFDREQDLANTPGALVQRPEGIMYDYLHPTPPEADTVQLTAFTIKQLHNWRAEYPERTPDEVTYMEPDPNSGLVLLVRTQSPDGDCGAFERWGHVGSGNDFVRVERREMPVCNGIAHRHWIQTYRADTISPGRE